MRPVSSDPRDGGTPPIRTFTSLSWDHIVPGASLGTPPMVGFTARAPLCNTMTRSAKFWSRVGENRPHFSSADVTSLRAVVFSDGSVGDSPDSGSTITIAYRACSTISGRSGFFLSLAEVDRLSRSMPMSTDLGIRTSAKRAHHYNSSRCGQQHKKVVP